MTGLLRKWAVRGCSLLCAMLFWGAPALAEGEFPALNAQGFLDSGEFVYENSEAGVWRYASGTLRVEIFKKVDEELRLTWYEAEIFTRDNEHFRMIPKTTEPDKRMRRMDYVHNIAKENGVVFALNSDFAHLRIQQKGIPGVLIREGQIIAERTRSLKSTKYPNLDNLALFPDGDMKVFTFNEHKAQEYLDMGVSDVLAFGPILVRDGQTDWKLLRKFGQYREPRTAIGMMEKGHYWALMVEGRHPGSKGASTTWLSEWFQKKGCPLAFNLDGGQSSTMVFMGKQIIRVGNTKRLTKPARSTAEILGIGFSQSLLDAAKLEAETEKEK